MDGRCLTNKIGQTFLGHDDKFAWKLVEIQNNSVENVELARKQGVGLHGNIKKGGSVAESDKIRTNSIA